MEYFATIIRGKKEGYILGEVVTEQEERVGCLDGKEEKGKIELEYASSISSVLDSTDYLTNRWNALCICK